MNKLLEKRRAGVLLHITSLPHQDLGEDAYHFIDFLHDTGVSVWQVLPLGTTHADGSPYQSLSAHAGNTNLISIDNLIKRGWLTKTLDCNNCEGGGNVHKQCLLNKAFYHFKQHASETEQADFKKFCHEKQFWLDDFALFMALRQKFNQQAWNQWLEPFKERDEKFLKDARIWLKSAIDVVKFEQYIFFTQWMSLKNYAKEKGILLFGDIPIFVSYDSADVWANRNVFKLDSQGEMQVVAGVPPDYFSATGQRWGNPHYNWEYLKKTKFRWWLERMKTQAEWFDILRIDHFRGLESAWEIPANEETAINGDWVKAAGAELLTEITTHFPNMALVAEDLGVITEEVDKLRTDFHLPGMKILQFAFGGDLDNPYLPNHHEKNGVVYTGTHDNDTTVGWAEKLSDNERQFVYDYLGNPATSTHCALIHATLASVANLAIIPMQDILELGSDCRMNTPGTTLGNWQWHFQWHQLSSDRANRLKYLVNLFNRNQ